MNEMKRDPFNEREQAQLTLCVVTNNTLTFD